MDESRGLDWRLKRIAQFSQQNDAKILLIVIDGLGGLPHPDFGALGPFDDRGTPTPKSELEWASLHGRLDNLNAFVRHSRTITGRVYPVGRGLTPGCITGHLGLFGYDPDHYFVKRGPAEGAAIDRAVEPGDIVGRFNFCRVDNGGIVQDRRAGRLKAAGRGAVLASKIEQDLSVHDAVVRVMATGEHRGLLVLRKADRRDPPLSERICATDPGVEGPPIIECQPLNLDDKAASRTATLVRAVSTQIREILADEPDANMIILRGFGTLADLPDFNDVYNVRAAAIATYPVYRGIASVLGMTVLDGVGESDNLSIGNAFGPEVHILQQNYSCYDFFYVHYKLPDETGIDKDFLGKVDALHQFDAAFPGIAALDFDVIAVTGDHATPSLLGRHSHHSVPLVIQSTVIKGYDRTQEFTEPACLQGARGFIDGPELMAILLGNAGKLRRFDG